MAGEDSWMIVIVMGVSGAGKSLIGQALARALGWRFYEGDDYHPEANREKLARGTELGDEDRAPWLRALRREIEGALARGENAVVVSSALKARYRQVLVVDPARVKIVYLKGSKELIRKRLEARRGHFMDPKLLDSQFETLEEPRDAIVVDVTPSPEEIVEEIQRRLKAAPDR